MSLITVINWIGTLAFAVSGALVGVKKRFDLLGVLVLGAVTAIGGGAIRDIIASQVPVALRDEHLLWGVLTVCVMCMCLPQWVQKFDRVLLYADALGLALFSALGAQVGCALHLKILGVVFLGSLSGVGGGVIRDLLSNEIPTIMLPQEIYAVAAAIGAASFYWLDMRYPNLALLCGAMVTFFIRIVSVYRGWTLPVSLSKDKNKT